MLILAEEKIFMQLACKSKKEGFMLLMIIGDPSDDKEMKAFDVF